MIKEKIKTRLNENGYRFTNQRKMIIDLLMNTNDHLTIKQICNSIQDPNLGQATVYRNIKLFSNLDIIRKLNFGKYDFYELDMDKRNHHHLICSECGKILEIDFKSLMDLKKEIQQKYDFEISYCNLKFFGMCKNCKEEKRRDNYENSC
ncbi:MAG: Fur family transcriptional regulator [Bacillota bacterium]